MKKLSEAQRRALTSLAQPQAYAYRKPRGSQYTIVGSQNKTTGVTLHQLAGMGYLEAYPMYGARHYRITDAGRAALEGK